MLVPQALAVGDAEGADVAHTCPAPVTVTVIES